jgi:transposase
MRDQSHFRAYQPDQLFLLPPDMKQWLSEDDLVYFVMDVVNQLDLSPIYWSYNHFKGGQPPYNPTMMVSLLIYAYCIGLPSSRRIEQATYHSIAFRVLTANQHPDHDTIADFRKRHLKALSNLFVDVLRLCQKAGLVKLGHVALDGSKIRANASKHKAMSYGRMEKKVIELQDEVNRLLSEAEARDAEEDALYGKGKRGDELPRDLRFKQRRLKKLQEAKKALEQEAREQAQKELKAYEAKKKAWDGRTERRGGRPPKAPSDKPEPKRQRNFTDPESQIMVDGATKSFEQCYNCQAAVDDNAQVVVATNVTQQTNDRLQIKPMLQRLKDNTRGKRPKKLSADSGYFSEANCKILASDKIDAYIATGKVKHTRAQPRAPRGRIPKNATVTERMTRKLHTIKGRSTYCKRKHIVEPVFGQIKEIRGFRRFSFRGLKNVMAEWNLICLTHNLLKVFRHQWAPKPA